MVQEIKLVLPQWPIGRGPRFCPLRLTAETESSYESGVFFYLHTISVPNVTVCYCQNSLNIDLLFINGTYAYLVAQGNERRR